MGEYTEELRQALRDRWKGHEEQLKALIPIFKADMDWHLSEAYKAVMGLVGPGPLRVGVKEREKDLRGADLMYADLSGGKLIGADLLGANLIEANLSEANLNGADFSGASLGGADLSGAILIDADLSKAILYDANLSGANLYLAEHTTDEILNLID